MFSQLKAPNSLLQSLARILNIHPGEGGIFTLLFVQAFVVGAIMISYYTAANALFLTEFGAAGIPYIYIVSAGVVTLAGLTFSRLQRYVSFSSLLTGTVIFLLLSIIGIWLTLQLTLAPWIMFAVMVWLRLLWMVSNLALWTLAGRLFNLDQSKRLYSLLMAGAILAIIITGLFIGPFVNRFGVINLILVTTIGLTIWLGVLSLTIRRFYDRINISATDTANLSGSSQTPFVRLLKNRYISLILIYIILSTLATYTLDFAFVSVVENKYNDVNALATFFSNYMAISTLILLAVSVAAGLIFSRYGLKVGIFANAIVVALGAGIVVTTNAVFGPLAILFWLVVLTKLCDDVLVIAMADTSTRILYQPLPPDQQTQVQTAGEGVVTPLSTGLAGVILLLFAAAGNVTTAGVLYILLVILAFWIVVSFLLNREYITALKQALTKRRLQPVSLTTVMDRSSLGVLQQGLTSPKAGTVLAALNLLTEIQPESLPGYLPTLLNHRVVEVRLETLRRIEQMRLTDAIPVIQQHIKNEDSLAVKGAALRVLAALGDSGTFDELDGFLNDPAPQIRQEVIIGFLRSGDLDRIVAAGEQLSHLVRSPNTDDRILAAQILGRAGLQGLHRSLLRLLEDDAPDVQQAALIAARKVAHPDLWPVVVRQLASVKLQATVLATLIAGGEVTMPALASAFDTFSQNRRVLIQLSKACGQIGGDRALALLKKTLDVPDEPVLNQVLISLSQIKYQATGAEQKVIQHKIKAEVAQAAWTLAALIDIEAETGQSQAEQTGALLKTTLNTMLAHYRARIFLWLSFIYDRQSILQIGNALEISWRPNNSLPANENSSKEKQAYALEIIEVLIASDLKGQLRPLLSDGSPKEQVQLLRPFYPQNSTSCHQRLEQIITGTELWFSPWVKAVAIYSVGQLAITELSDIVMTTVSNPDPFLRETALWSLSRLDTGADWRDLEGQNGRKVMLSTIERVLILKAVSFFVDTSEEVLVEIAAVLEEADVQPDTRIFSEGDPGHTLYIIVDGEIRIHNKQQTLAILSENEVFGEMSILDPAPRSATATAITETRLLSLDQEMFNEITADHHDVAQGVMRLLARRLRQTQTQPEDTQIQL